MLRSLTAILALLIVGAAILGLGGPASAQTYQDNNGTVVSATVSIGGAGALQAVPAGSTNGTPIGTRAPNSHGVRLYLPSGSSVTFTIAPSQPGSAPSATFTVSSTTGPNWDESLDGQMIYVTATSGSPLFRWY